MGREKTSMRLVTVCTLIAVAVALPRQQRKTCDFSQVASNPNYSSDTDKPNNGNQYCDYNFAGNFSSFRSCGGDQPNGESYPPCKDTYNDMMYCGPNFAPHSDCKFGDSFLGKIGCKYSNAAQSVLLSDDQQPVTCKQAYSWCCPCGYDNDGKAERSCGSFASKERAWSVGYRTEKLLPDGELTLEQVQSWGWYSSSQLYSYCNVGGKCTPVKPDDPFSTPGGCDTQPEPPTACIPKNKPPTPPASPAPSKKCDWATEDLACGSDADCAAWATANCEAQQQVSSYCRTDSKHCHFKGV